MFAALVVVPALLFGGFAATSARAGGDGNAASFVAEANAERQARGLPAYVVKPDLAAVAARHSARMAPQRSLYHNPNLGSEIDGWQLAGENVGDGGSLGSIHRAFMDSPAHRDNILSREYTEIGVGTVTDSRGVLWVTQVFRLPARAQVPVVAAPVTAQASRSLTQASGRAVAPEPVAYVAPKRPAPVRPDASAFVAVLAYAGAGPFAQALAYADTMAALAR